jgi:hypothetical protein
MHGVPEVRTNGHNFPHPVTPPTTIADGLRHLFAQGSVVELRVLGVQRRQERPHTESGFFDYDHFDKLDEFALALEPFARGVYVTLNPLKRSILSRRCNRTDYAEDRQLASDRDVMHRRWLLIDADPVRDVTDISATEEEKAAAGGVINAVRTYLAGQGWPAPMLADSGNGYHLLYPIDLPADDRGVVMRCLEALAEQFDSDRVKIDRAVFNPSRITKLYGTLARKGDDSPERPHRRSALLEVPDKPQPVPLEKLQALAEQAPEPLPAPTQSSHVNTNRRLNVPQWLEHYGQAFRQKETDSKGRTRYVLEHCPFDPTHVYPDSCVFQDADGKTFAKCLHNSCTGRGWQEFKDRIGKPLPEHYDGQGAKAELVFPVPVVMSELEADAAELAWLWRGFIAACGITLFSALWKAGKTTLLAHLLRKMGTAQTDAPGPGIAARISHASSSTLCGREVTPGTALVVSEEFKTQWIKRRDALLIGDHVHLICRPFKGKPTVANWEAFLQHVQRHALAVNARLVVLDTISALWPVRNENDAPEVQAALMPLWSISERSAVLVSHHLKKGDGAEATGSRGSGALPGFVDTIMELRRADASNVESRKRVITAYGRDDETPPELVIELDATTNEYRSLGDRKGARLEEAKRTVLKLLPSEAPGMTLEEIKENWGVDEFPRKGTMLNILAEGADRGEWTRVGEGRKGSPYRYFVPPAPAD